MISMTTRHVSLLLAVLATACSSGRAIVRLNTAALGEAAGPPTLEKAVDLGAMPPAKEGTLSTLDSDNWFTPGEWVALLGSELVPTSKVSVAGRPMEIGGFLEGGSLLVRIPRGVPPGLQPITVDNGRGKASIRVNLTSFAWGADFRGDALRFRLLGANQDQFAKRDMDIKFAKARYGALSPEGGFLYVMQEPDYAGAFTPDSIEAVKDMVGAAQDAGAPCKLMVVNMGGRGGPAQVGLLTLELTTRPNALAAGPRNLVVALEQRHLYVVDVSDPKQPRQLAKLEVVAFDKVGRDLVDAEFLGGGRYVAVLEAYENKIHLVDLQDPAAPRVVSAGSVALADAQAEPFSIDLAPGPGGKTVYALQGPNLRLAGKKLKDGVKNVWNSAKVGFKTAPGAGEAPIDTLSRVAEVALEGDRLVIKHSVPLPKDLFPFFVASDSRGKLYVSALHGENPFDDLTPDLKGVGKLLEGLRDAAQFSRVISVEPATGKTETVLQSMAIYCEVVLLPTGRLLASLTRLGPGFIPPRITLDWGFEIVGGDFVKLREVANTAFGLTEAITRLLPPYRFERVGAQ